uniref:Integrase_H2C2 domain-containing protein n=1 Tax=Strongyloides venezuelensis TaxID=75913 RepID=A0A0K0FJJ6_STRVS
MGIADTLSRLIEDAKFLMVKDSEEVVLCGEIYIPQVRILTDAHVEIEAKQDEEYIELYKRVVGGHVGRKKMSEILRKMYFWPFMNDYVAVYVRKCEACQKYCRKLAVVDVGYDEPKRILSKSTY